MRVAILGTGNMGKALIGGLLQARAPDTSVIAFDQKQNALQGLDPGVSVIDPSKWFISDTPPDVIVIAVKPSDISAAFTSFGSALSDRSRDPLWISIAAGISIATLSKLLPSHARICRVMPNTPALIGEGISAYALNERCHADDAGVVEQILSGCGKTVAVPEKCMNAVTGLSGSGPAYVYLFIEALIEGGITAGLSYQVAKECAVQTVIGSARMVELSKNTPSELKSKVMSPGGTTVSGLMALEKHAFRHAVMSAVVDAARKAEALGN